jgi:hypothetical protein
MTHNVQMDFALSLRKRRVTLHFWAQEMLLNELVFFAIAVATLYYWEKEADLRLSLRLSLRSRKRLCSLESLRNAANSDA